MPQSQRSITTLSPQMPWAAQGRLVVWIDGAGVFHTVALPDPRHIMTVQFVGALDRMIEQDLDATNDVVASAEDKFYETELGREFPGEESLFEAMQPPSGLLDAAPTDADGLKRIIDAVDRRWRLDVIIALTDYLDALDEDLDA